MSCPCPKCFKCCCHKVEGLDPNDCVNAEDGVCECEDEERVDWLCGCGNGRLSVPESEVPEFCPLCGAPVAAMVDDYDDYDDSMDGDHESALASCGWGTDEDYGCFDDGGDF